MIAGSFPKIPYVKRTSKYFSHLFISSTLDGYGYLPVSDSFLKYFFPTKSLQNLRSPSLFCWILAGGHHEPPDGCGWAALVRRSGGGS